MIRPSWRFRRHMEYRVYGLVVHPGECLHLPLIRPLVLNADYIHSCVVRTPLFPLYCLPWCNCKRSPTGKAQGQKVCFCVRPRDRPCCRRTPILAGIVLSICSGEELKHRKIGNNGNTITAWLGTADQYCGHTRPNIYKYGVKSP